MENAPNSATIPDSIQTNESNQENAPNVEPDVQQAVQAVQVVQAVPEATESIEAQPKRRGRPAGAKDRAPRKSCVVELDIPDTLAAPAQVPAPAPAPAAAPAPAPAPEPEPEPLTPRRLYRETAAHLVHLKQMIQSDKRKALAEAYTRKLITLP